MLGTLVASMSDRLEGQGAILDKLTKTAAETRAAAFHAKSQMDMKPGGGGDRANAREDHYVAEP